MRNFVIIFSFLLSTLSIFAGTSESKVLDVKLTKPQVTLIPDLTYSLARTPFGVNVNLQMDILQPRTGKAMPAVLFITGGAFVEAPKESYIQQRLAIAEEGYVVASATYRVVPMVTFPGVLEDVKAAVRYLRANAERFGIDPSRIAVMGESAGGYLSAFLGTSSGTKEFDKGQYLDQSSDVQAAIDLYGLSDLTKIGSDYPEMIQNVHKSPASPESMLINGIAVFGPGGSIMDTPEKAKAANPINYISDKTPPFLIMHGDKDGLVSPSQTEMLHKALVKKGIDSTRYLVKGANHADVYWYQDEILDVIIDFLDKNLKNK